MIALLAGSGALPGVLVAALRAAGRPVLICELAGFPVTGTADLPKITFRYETLGSFLKTLQTQGVTEVCLAGSVRRPAVDPALIDAETWPLVPRVQAALREGDDGALRALVAILEERGFILRAPHEIAPELLPPEGMLTVAKPTEAHLADVLRAEAVHRALAAADVGQACVLRRGQVVALEAEPGTDWMLRSLMLPPVVTEAQATSVEKEVTLQTPDTGSGRRGPGDPLTWAVDTAGDVISSWADWLTGPEAPSAGHVQGRGPRQVPAPAPSLPEAGGIARGGLLYKAPKAGQDRRLDLPVIGPQTVTLAAAAGLSAIVIEAGGVMVLDSAETARRADRAGLAIWVRPVSA
ncbi:MAG: UDP-2,3-diacylglucosamine diphosphatase LpxI [Rubellimicrobium sp.]|nr:UDP-2,3-diacylglucosamine diphosphatase LpxI [Rubellimicrobium sp.]